MIKLVPSWAVDYQEYWDSIKNRNNWFIQLRYGAIVMLLMMFLVVHFIFKFNFYPIQRYWFVGISSSIIIYNTLFFVIRKKIECVPGKFNALHFSLLQMILDLIALTLLVYFTGSIETPLYMLFIFHMIIGSLILPRHVILTMSGILIIVFSTIVMLEHLGIIYHYHVSVLYSEENVHNIKFIISTLSIFIFTIFTTVFITSRIANKLYKREQQLKETLEALNRAEETKQKYIMAVVHEIKSPIVAAQSLVELISNGYLGEINIKVKEKLLRTRKRTDEALNLINNILRISKLKLLDEITYEDVDIQKFIQMVVDQKIELLTNKKIRFKIKDSRKNKSAIQSDPVMLELVFSNIIGNAIKYSHENQQIIVDISNTNKFINIDISDMGIGIPEDEIHKIFQQFYRATNITSKQVEGSGLGLSLVKEIVERLNGSINIASPSKIGNKKYPGTTVSIKFPN